MYHYQAYALTINSEISLPGLELGDGCRPPDVTIQYGTFKRPVESIHPGGACLYATQSEVILAWERVGAIRIQSGEEVLVDAYRDSDPKLLSLCIIGPVIAVLLHQRNYLILHASAVLVGGEAVIFLGNSGDGKSTIAASLLELGHQFLSDDIVAIRIDGTPQPMICGGFPLIKLWPDASGGLGILTDEMSALHPKLKKKALRDSFEFRSTITNLKLAYILKESELPEPRIIPLSPQNAMVEIVRYSFLIKLLDEMGSSVQHFHQVSQLVNSVPIRILNRRKDLSELRKVACLVEEDIRS